VLASPKAVVPIVAVMASSAVSVAHAANPLKPDPNPAAAVARLRPDPGPGATRAVAHHALTGSVAGSAIRLQAASSTRRDAGTGRSAPGQRLRIGSARTSPAHSRHRGGARAAVDASLAAAPRHWRILPTPTQLGLGGRRLVRSSVRERTSLLAAAAALAAVVLGSGSLLMLTRSRLFQGG
jgi:hypothetical protein